MRDPGPDLYQVLGVSRDASGADITRAYRQQALTAHPDTAPPGAGTTARFRAVSEAYQVLGDPARRAGYDRAVSRQQAPGHGQAASRRGARPAGAVPPIPAGQGPAPVPALWAGPTWFEPLPSHAPGSGHQAERPAAAWPGLVHWYLSVPEDGLW
jgi:curved DNA-binding protein CbpA